MKQEMTVYHLWSENDAPANDLERWMWFQYAGDGEVLSGSKN